MSIFQSFNLSKALRELYGYPHLKTLYKGSIFGFDEVVNLYRNIIKDGNSAELFGHTFYGLEKVNYYTLDEIFMNSVYDFQCDNPQPVILDCGANIGLSVLYFKRKHKDAIVYAFEPDNKNADFLEKNIKSYQWENSVFLERKIVSDSEGFAYFDERGNAGSTVISEDMKTDSTTKIPKVRLLNFIKSLNQKIDFLKLDVEGAEFEIIPDLKPVYSMIDKMYIEFHCDENNFDEMYDFIKKHLGADFHFQISTNFTEDQNIYTALQSRNSKTYYNCFLVSKNLLR